MSAFSPTSSLAHRDAVKPVRKLLGEKDVEAILQRLDRLTQDEAQTSAVQTLEVVHGLVRNINVVMDGEETYSACTLPSNECPSLQTARHRLTVSGKCSVRFLGDGEIVPCLTER